MIPIQRHFGRLDLDPLTSALRAVGRRAGRAEGHWVGELGAPRTCPAPQVCHPSSVRLSPQLETETTVASETGAPALQRAEEDSAADAGPTWQATAGGGGESRCPNCVDFFFFSF